MPVMTLILLAATCLQQWIMAFVHVLHDHVSHLWNAVLTYYTKYTIHKSCCNT